MEEKFQQAVAVNKKLFGTPVFQYEPGTRELYGEDNGEGWDMLAEARPLDITHTVDANAVDDLLLGIMEDPPVLPQAANAYPVDTIEVDPVGQEE